MNLLEEHSLAAIGWGNKMKKLLFCLILLFTFVSPLKAANLNRTIQYMFPGIINANPDNIHTGNYDYILTQDQNGLRIDEWTYGQPQPTQQEFDDNELPAFKADRILDFKRIARNEVSLLDDQTIQHRDQQATDGVTPDLTELEYQTILSTKQTIRVKFKTKRTAINAATTIEEVEAIQW